MPILADWAERIPVDQIPDVLAFLSNRWLKEASTRCIAEHVRSNAITEKYVTAGALAEHLSLPESWVRNEERMGHIPSIRAGRYVRFRLSEVENALAERKQLSPKSRSFG
jgi:hypothetical protein